MNPGPDLAIKMAWVAKNAEAAENTMMRRVMRYVQDSIECVTRFLLIVFAGCTLLPTSSSMAASSGDLVRYHDKGVLQRLEKQNSQYIATIDDHEFVVDKEGILVILDGKPTTLSDLKMPKNVVFEYVYLEKKNRETYPVVVYVEVDSHEVKNEGRGK